MEAELQKLSISQLELANKLKDREDTLCIRSFPVIAIDLIAKLVMNKDKRTGTVTIYKNNTPHSEYEIAFPCSFVSRQVHKIAKAYNDLLPELYWHSKCLLVQRAFLQTRQEVFDTLAITSLKDIKTEHSDLRTAQLCHRLATDFHQGQVDKAGKPYIEHPVSVAREFSDECLQSIALLHDVLEDTDCTSTLLRSHQIPAIIIASVEALTRKQEIDYLRYVESVTKDPYAMLVKLADLSHNMDLNRLEQYDDKVYKRCVRYNKAIETILQVLKTGGNS